jgi:RNA polymerase sigma-70 factor (ECF subfamily)
LHNEVPSPRYRRTAGAGTVRRTDAAIGRTDDFEELLSAVGAVRDGDAFTLLFDHFVPRVQAQMLRHGLPSFAAADVTQDVMETIWRKAHLFDAHKAAASTWIFHIARNRRIDVKRRCRETPCANEDFYDIPDPHESCEDCLDASRREACLRSALRTLPREQLTLVKLAFYDGLSHSEIAERMKLPLGTVKSRFRLAFSRLRRCLLEAGVTEA